MIRCFKWWQQVRRVLSLPPTLTNLFLPPLVIARRPDRALQERLTAGVRGFLNQVPLLHCGHSFASFGPGLSAACSFASHPNGGGASLAALAGSTSLRSVSTIFASNTGSGTRPSTIPSSSFSDRDVNPTSVSIGGSASTRICPSGGLILLRGRLDCYLDLSRFL